MRVHVRGDEGRQVETCVAVEHELVVHDLVGDLRADLLERELVHRHAAHLAREDGLLRHVALLRAGAFGVS